MRTNMRIPFLCVATGVVFAIVVAMTEGNGKESVTTLNRPGIGASETKYQLNVNYDGVEGNIELELGERKLSFVEIQEIFERGKEEIISIFERKNGDTEAVTDDLYLPETVLGESVEVIWRSSNRQYIFDDGVLNRDGCKNISELGQIVTMTAKMVVQGYESELIIPVCIMPEMFSEEEKQLNLLMEKLGQVIEKSAREEVVELPSQIAGKAVKYFNLKEKNWWKFFVLGILAAIIYFLMQKKKETDAQKKYNKELQMAYAALITKFSLLIGAGITIKGAWERLVIDYKKETKPNVAYEEMVKVYNEMKNGLSEGQAYVLFGKRCKLSSYIRFGNLLEQNLRKGTKGLAERLEYEVWEAFEERKALAYRLGEEAGTKLLIPMLMSLGIVITFCIVPAFLNM